MTVHEEIYKECRIRIDTDEFAESPREWHSDCTMACWHNRYKLGDVQPKENPCDYQRGIKDHYITPIFLYDHGGITISTKPFSCPWDSGQVGLIHTPKNEWGNKEHAVNVMEQEVESYDSYLRGENYVWSVKGPDGEVIGCVGGYVGYKEKGYMIECAKDEINNHLKQ